MKSAVFAFLMFCALVSFTQPATEVNEVMLKLRFADGKNAAEIVRDIRVGYINQNTEMPELSDDGNILLKDCPADAEYIRVFIEYGSEILKDSLLKNVKLNQGTAGKNGEVIIPDIQDCSIIFFNKNKSIITPDKLRGTVTYNNYSIDSISSFLSFQNDNPETIKSMLYIPLLETDKHGTLLFSKIPTQKYDIRFYSNNSAAMPIIIDGNTKIKSIIEAHFNLDNRDVNMTKVKSETDYFLSYSWNGVINYKKVTSDRKNVLHLKNIPPVKVIIWNNTGDTFLLNNDNSVSEIYPEIKVSQFYICFPSLENIEYNGEILCKNLMLPEKISSDTNSENQIPGVNASGVSGNKCSFYAVVDTDKDIFRFKNTMYIPFFEDTEYAKFTVPPVEQKNIKLTLKSKSNTIIKTQLPVMLKLRYLDNADDLISVVNDDIVYPHKYDNGEYGFTIINNRKYQLNIDTYSDTYEIPDNFNIDALKENYIITLPEPMLKVPAGTDFYFVTYHRPGKINKVTAADFANPMPFYGEKSRILRYWYKKSGTELVIYDNKQISTRKLVNTSRNILSVFDNDKMIPTLFTGWIKYIKRQSIIRIWQGKYYVEDKNTQKIYDTKNSIIKLPVLNMIKYNMVFNENSDEDSIILCINKYQNELIVNRNKTAVISLPTGIDDITAYYPGTGLAKCRIEKQDIIIGIPKEENPLTLIIPSKMTCVAMLIKLDNSNIRYSEDLKTEKKIIYGYPYGRYMLRVVEYATSLSYDKDIFFNEKTNVITILKSEFKLQNNRGKESDLSNNLFDVNKEIYHQNKIWLLTDYGKSDEIVNIEKKIVRKSSGGLSIIVRDKLLWSDRNNIRIIIDGTGENKNIHLNFEKLNWIISAEAGYMSFDFSYFPPGKWNIKLISNQLPKESFATINEYGGYALFN